MKVYQAVDKKFLNLEPHEGGSIQWFAQAHKEKNDGNSTISAEVDISDCFKKISLEFYCNSPAKFKKRIDKLDTLINSLLSFRASMYEAREEKVKAILKYRKEKKGERFPRKETEEVCKTRLSDIDL